MSGWIAQRPGRFTPGARCTAGWVGVVACLNGMGAENLGVRTPDRPSRSVTLLSRLGPYTVQAVTVAGTFRAHVAEFEKCVNIKHYRDRGR